MRRSALKDELASHGVALVAVGLEELGLEEFLEGGFFTGDLYIDLGKACYKVRRAIVPHRHMMC